MSTLVRFPGSLIGTLDCRVFVLWLYAGFCRVSSESVVDVLAAADLLRAPSFVHHIEQVILQNVDSSSFAQLWPYVLLHGTPFLKSAFVAIKVVLTVSLLRTPPFFFFLL